jgi:hypothetical protein
MMEHYRAINSTKFYITKIHGIAISTLNWLIVLIEKSNILFGIVLSSFLRFILTTLPISNYPTRISEYFLGFIARPWFIVLLFNKLFMTSSFAQRSFAILINSRVRSTILWLHYLFFCIVPVEVYPIMDNVYHE